MEQVFVFIFHFYFSFSTFPNFYLFLAISFRIHCLFSPFIRDYHQITLLEPTFCFPWRLCPIGRKKFMLIFSPKGSLSVSKLFNFSSFSFHYKKNIYNYIANNKNFTKLNIRINLIYQSFQLILSKHSFSFISSISFWISIYCYINIQ